MARWSAERIGPTIIAAPHRGQAQVARGCCRRGPVAVASMDRSPSMVWRAGPRERDAAVATGVREKARLADAHEAARQDVLDEAAEKLHGRERHRAPLIAMGVVLPLKGDVVAIEGEQPVIADRDPMGIAPEIPQDG